MKHKSVTPASTAVMGHFRPTSVFKKSSWPFAEIIEAFIDFSENIDLAKGMPYDAPDAKPMDCQEVVPIFEDLFNTYLPETPNKNQLSKRIAKDMLVLANDDKKFTIKDKVYNWLADHIDTLLPRGSIS